MNGELAQAAVLASHASAWLHQPGGPPPPRLDVDHGTFRFVRSVSFIPSDGSAGLDAVAPWLLRLRDEGVERLWLATGKVGGPLAGHTAAAFAGGGSWYLVATGASSTMWTGAWMLGDRDAPDHRIWDVRYTSTPVPATVPFPSSVEAAQALLVEALLAIHAFAREHKLGFWAEYLAKALDLQDAPADLDLFPDRGYGDAARRLAAMASQAWVFGGMGSSNDLGFPTAADNDRYEAVTAQLYEAVLAAIVAAVNVELTP